MTPALHCDLAIVGGGLVGAALAHGLRALGPRLVVVDEGDRALRAARGNFGLIWVQGKGLGLAAYGGWTQRAAREWVKLAADLEQETGIDVALRQAGLSAAAIRAAGGGGWPGCPPPWERCERGPC